MDRLYRLMLLAHPPALRRQHGREMTAAFAERWRAEGRGLRGRVRLVALLFTDFAVSGSSIGVNQRPVTVVGIVPAWFRGFSLRERPEVFLSLSAMPAVATGFHARSDLPTTRNSVWLQIAGRLRAGVTPETARTATEQLYRRAHSPDVQSGRIPEPVTLAPLSARALGMESAADLRQFVVVLPSATGAMLLLACGAVGSPLLVRTRARRREFAIRAALGGGRLRVVRLLTVESALLGLGGVAAGRGLGREVAATMYLLAAQHPRLVDFGGNYLFVRAADGADAGQAAQIASGVVTRIDRAVPVTGVATLDDAFGETLLAQRLGLTLFLLFGVLALVLTTLGLHAIVAHAVALRRREIGIRLALGAWPSRVLGLMARQGLAPVAAGLAVGAIGLTLGGPLLERFLFAVPAVSPGSLAALVAFILALAAAAMFVPVQHALRIQPTTALRED